MTTDLRHNCIYLQSTLLIIYYTKARRKYFCNASESHTPTIPASSSNNNVENDKSITPEVGMMIKKKQQVNLESSDTPADLCNYARAEYTGKQTCIKRFMFYIVGEQHLHFAGRLICCMKRKLQFNRMHYNMRYEASQIYFTTTNV